MDRQANLLTKLFEKIEALESALKSTPATEDAKDEK